jgi:hypothetical protein
MCRTVEIFLVLPFVKNLIVGQPCLALGFRTLSVLPTTASKLRLKLEKQDLQVCGLCSQSASEGNSLIGSLSLQTMQSRVLVVVRWKRRSSSWSWRASKACMDDSIVLCLSSETGVDESSSVSMSSVSSLLVAPPLRPVKTISSESELGSSESKSMKSVQLP